MHNALTTAGRSRYRVKMFETQFRVLIESKSNDKDLLLLGTNDLAEANAAFEIAVSNNPGRTVMVMDGARIMRKSES